MTRRVVVLASIAVSIAAVAWYVAVDAARDGEERRRIHAANMIVAEQFHREFTAHVTPGAELAVVESYLRTKPVVVQRSMVPLDGKDWVGELLIEIVGERSVNWYCGHASVGMIAKFSRDRLQGTHVSSWSFDCP